MNTITIGCDPEFALINSLGQRIIIDYKDKIFPEGTITKDHGGAVGELNPTYNENPKIVVNNLRHLILEVKTLYPNHKLVAGGGAKYQTSTGGHIHIGNLPSDFLNFTIQNYRYRVKSSNKVRPETYGNKLILLLDAFIGSKMQKLQNAKRFDKQYNKLSKIKTKVYSKQNISLSFDDLKNKEALEVKGFEYRSAPSFLTSPFVAEATLATAQLITNILIIKPNAFDAFLKIDSNGNYPFKYIKSQAKFRDFDLLINDISCNSYYRQQIFNFKSIIFNKNFDLADINAFSNWENLSQKNIKNDILPKIPKINVQKSKRKINLIPCKIKFLPNVKFDNVQFIEENINFVRSEIICKHSPYMSDAITISKTLKPYLKIPKNLKFKIKFRHITDNMYDIYFPQATIECKNFITKIFTDYIKTHVSKKHFLSGFLSSTI